MGLTSDCPPGDSVIIHSARRGANIPLKHYSDLNIGNFLSNVGYPAKFSHYVRKWKELFLDDALHVFIVLMIYMKP